MAAADILAEGLAAWVEVGTIAGLRGEDVRPVGDEVGFWCLRVDLVGCFLSWIYRKFTTAEGSSGFLHPGHFGAGFLGNVVVFRYCGFVGCVRVGCFIVSDIICVYRQHDIAIFYLRSSPHSLTRRKR